eukprot:scaffold6733_cov100-Isochrysis_galbana.AAC.3
MVLHRPCCRNGGEARAVGARGRGGWRVGGKCGAAVRRGTVPPIPSTCPPPTTTPSQPWRHGATERPRGFGRKGLAPEHPTPWGHGGHPGQ